MKRKLQTLAVLLLAFVLAFLFSWQMATERQRNDLLAWFNLDSSVDRYE